jgi:hypothetical protein
LLLSTLARGQAGPSTAPVGELDALSLPECQIRPWRFRSFPILAWWPPPGNAKQVDFDAYRDAGFTLYPLNPDSGQREAYSKARAAGLAIMGFRTAQGFDLPAETPVLKPGDPGVVGWISRDEPQTVEECIAAIRDVNELMRADPESRALFNFLPPFAQAPLETNRIAEAAIRNGLPVLSYDHYVMIDQGLDEKTTEHARHAERYFEFLEQFRVLSLKHDVPFWAFALSIRHAYYRRPSESDLRWNQFVNLAYGAKGLWYFTYWGPTDWPRWDSVAIVDPGDGSPTDLYSVAKDINRHVLSVGELLLRLTSRSVAHTDPMVRRPFTDTQWIQKVEGDAIVGFFEDEDGIEYALVVGDRHGANQTAAALRQELTLRLRADIRTVDVLMNTDGQLTIIHPETGSWKTTLSGGGAMLLRAGR